MNPEIKIDKEFRDLLPRLDSDRLSGLESKILAEGCTCPLVRWKGRNILIDGHHRYEIYQKHGIEFSVQDIDFADRADARIWIHENQDRRRNLTDDQRAMLATELADDYSAVAKRERAVKANDVKYGRSDAKDAETSLQTDAVCKQKDKRRASKGWSRARAAKKMEVSERRVRESKKLKDKSPWLAELVKNNVISRADAARLTKVDKAKAKQAVELMSSKGMSVQAALKQINKSETEAKKAVPDVIPRMSDNYRLFHKGIENVCSSDIPDNSIDWIITDPPYPKGYLGVYEHLAILGQRVLKPGGGMLVMVGQSYLPEILAMMTPHIRYHWTVAYLTPGGQSTQLWERNVNTFWKPVLWFCKGDYSGGWIGDVAKSNTNDNDKKHHHWGQSESGMADLIHRFTNVGQEILDPFLGGGTTGVVAISMARKFVGVEIDEDTFRSAKQRISESVKAA